MVDVPEDVELLDLPAGRYSVQRVFYRHGALKAFYRPGSSFEELNHINFDWYAPANAHRQSPDEVWAWCQEAGLAVEREFVDMPGITAIARRRVEHGRSCGVWSPSRCPARRRGTSDTERVAPRCASHSRPGSGDQA